MTDNTESKVVEKESFKPVSHVLGADSEKNNKSLKYSVIDGSFYSVMAGFGESFFSAFAIFLGATSSQLGMLSALPQMIGSYSQLFSRRLITLFGSKRKLVVWSATLQALMHLVILCAYYFQSLSIQFLIGAVSLYYLFGMIMGPAWNSWMGDLVDVNVRGTYFGRRNFVCGFASFASLLTAGYLLQFYTDSASQKFFGFVFLFTIAVCARLASAYFLSQMFEPKAIIHDKNPLPFVNFLRAFRTSNIGTFLAFSWLLNFGVAVSAPFFTPYMLGELHLSYMQFTLVTAAAIVAKLLFMPVWGRAMDKYGTRKLMLLSAWLVVIVPGTWLFGSSFAYLIIIQLFSGFAWAGLELTTFNYLFDVTKSAERASVIAYHNVINGTIVLIGSLIGGWFVTIGFVPGWSDYLGVFLLSSLIRFAACAIFIVRVKEIRLFEKSKYRHLLFKELTLEPTLGLIAGAVEVSVKTRRRVTHLFYDIDEFIDRTSTGARIKNFFMDIEEFVERRLGINKDEEDKDESMDSDEKLK